MAIFCFLTNERKLMITGVVVPGISGAIANAKTILLSSPVVRLSGAEIFILKTAPISSGPFSRVACLPLPTDPKPLMLWIHMVRDEVVLRVLLGSLSEFHW